MAVTTTRSDRARRSRRALREVVSLPPRDGAVVALAAGLLAWYRIRFALPGPWGGYRFLHRRIVTSRAAGGPHPTIDPARVARLAELFRCAVGSTIVGASCVPRSLALARLLDLHGVPAEIRIGVRRAGPGFAGHAWVEHHGAVIVEPREFVGTFVPLSFGVPSSASRLVGAP